MRKAVTYVLLAQALGLVFVERAVMAAGPVKPIWESLRLYPDGKLSTR